MSKPLNLSQKATLLLGVCHFVDFSNTFHMAPLHLIFYIRTQQKLAENLHFSHDGHINKVSRDATCARISRQLHDLDGDDWPGGQRRRAV
ncbi:hypothetical protein ARMSODRAFT_538023 [Armillaria solidipes]|uniref:Uncharacterized protein n=1 Tax=Armillaria solidipes TaxID=1076256 RepID=A0A2H3BKF7_9AGAR|nr:hypothetical protein ARMSODRAFT_538023 [Armillaria solidipes]